MNLPVRNLKTSIKFYEAIGCKKNDNFSADDTAMMVWSDSITFQLLEHSKFQTFTPRPVANSHATCEMLLALSRDSSEEVDRMAEAAAQAGGKADIRAPQVLGFMLVRTFEDPDGHIFEAAWMDMASAAARNS